MEKNILSERSEDETNQLIRSLYITMLNALMVRTGGDEKYQFMFNLLSWFSIKYQLGDLFPISGVLSDYGFIGIKDSILNKPASLNCKQHETIKHHIDIGLSIFSRMNVAFNLEKPISFSQIDIIQNHHERIDGSGYPSGLLGINLSVPAKIVGLVDTVAAILSNRAYRKRKAHSLNEALKILVQEQPNGFDQDLLKDLNNLNTDLVDIGSKFFGYMVLKKDTKKNIEYRI